ncbi:MAG: PKD domain-containing protein, partial [Thermoplasmata archaeon]
LDTNASWLGIDPLNGLLSGIPGTFDVGSYWLDVTLYDGNGGFDFLNFTITVNDISPPIVNAGADDTTDEDTSYTFDGSASIDNSGQISNYTWYFGDGEIGYGVSPTHIYTTKSIYLVFLVVRDASGNEGYNTLELTVLNPAPVAVTGLDKTANEGENVNFDASGSYDTTSDNSSLTYLWDFDGDGEFDDGMGVISSFVWYDEGVYTITLKVIDDNGDYSTDTINITVYNLPPFVDLGGPYTGLEGDRIYFFLTSNDAGNDLLRYRWDWDNDGVNDTGWSTVPYADHTWWMFGTYTVGVQVWDGDNGYTNDTTFVEVIRLEQPPVISGVGGRYVHFDYPYLLNLEPYIFDPDTPKDELIITTSPASYISVSGLILTLNYPESMVGDTRIVIISVSDGKNMDNDTLTVSITANYPPEVSGEIPDVTFDEGETLHNAFELDNYFTDEDNDPLSYHFLRNIHVRPDINSSTSYVTFSADPNWYGVENLTVRAYDPLGAFTEQVIKVTVNAVNYPPTIKGIQDVYVRLDSPWELFVLNPVYVWDDDSILDLTLSTNSSFVTLSPTKEGVLVFYYIDPSITIEILQISVSDGEYTASTDVTVHISLLNWPPYIKDYGYPPNVRFDEDTMLEDHFDLNDYFADNATDQLTFTPIITSSDIFVTIDTQGLVSFSARENWFGISTVTFRAQDSAGAWVSFTINVTVHSVNDAPWVVQKITYLHINEDEMWIIDLDDYFEDVEDKDNLTFTCNKPDIIIDPVTHEARWKRNQKSSLEGVIFTASDGELTVSMEKVNLGVIETFNWLWLFMAAILGALGVFVYRELRYRYKVEETFLLNNAGIILSHLSHGESKMAVDVELVGAMLTAIQDFVRDSFSKGEQDGDVIIDKKKSLERLEFGGFHLVMEQGNLTCLCAVISGYVNKRLRKRMRTVLDEFEGKYADVLQDWDGMMESFEDAEAIIAELFRLGGGSEELKSSLKVIKEVTDEDWEMYSEEMQVGESMEGGEREGVKEEELKDDPSSSSD